jgi:tetratricopeptide (TPR) repeat protein/anti-sigma regulatory factor (Ser/Thr protein kinase)
MWQKLLSIAPWQTLSTCLGMYFFALPIILAAQQSPSLVKEQRQIWYNSKLPAHQRLLAGKHLQEYYRIYATHHKDSLVLISKQMIDYGKKNHLEEWILQGTLRLGSYHQDNGDLQQALVFYRQMQGYSALQDFKMGHLVYSKMGQIYMNMSLLDSASYYLKKAIKLGHQSEVEPKLMGSTFGNLGVIHGMQGQYFEAIEYHQKVLEVAPIIHKVKSYIAIGNLFMTLGWTSEARASFEKGLVLAKASGDPRTVLHGYRAKMQMTKDLAEVRSIIHQAMAICDSFQMNQPRISILINAGRLFLDSLRHEEAQPYLQQALDLAQKFHRQLAINKVTLELAKINQLKGQYQSALHQCQMILVPLEKKQDPDLLFRLYDLLSKCHSSLKQPEPAIYYLQKREEQATRLLNENTRFKEIIGQYIHRQNEKKQEALQLAKVNAEKLTLATRAKARTNNALLWLLSLFLAGTVVVYFTFYRQKKAVAVQLTQINQLLEDEKQKLTFSNNKLKRFSGVVSHDILSNLNLILSIGNVWVGSRPNYENLNKYYSLTQNTSHHLKDYCLGLLAEAKDSPNLALAEMSDPNTVLNKVMERLSPALQAHGFVIEKGELLEIGLPFSILEHALQNLISNTLLYIGKTSNPLLQIGSSIDSEGNLCWYVADNGPGRVEVINRAIAGQELPSQKGQGMGLYLLQNTLQDYGWGLKAEAVEGGGIRMLMQSRN